MGKWRNVSQVTYERPGDGTNDGWLAEPGDVIEADDRPLPDAFEPADGSDGPEDVTEDVAVGQAGDDDGEEQ